MAKRNQTWTLKEIDQSRDEPKGTAFRAFKELKEGMDEGSDFFYLSATEDAAEIETLRAAGRIYQTTINALLFTEAGMRMLQDFLDDN